jgi:hypothetical protein
MADSPTSPPQRSLNWILADCPACEKTMKIRREMVGPRAFLCPNCKAPIAIEFSDPEAANRRDAEAAKPAAPPSTYRGRYGRLKKPAEISATSQTAATPAAGEDLNSTPPPPENRPAPETTTETPPSAAPSILPAPRTQRDGNRLSPETHGEKRINTAGLHNLDPDFKSKLRTIDAVEQSEVVPRHKTRIKGRLADWNSSHADGLMEAEASADEWTEHREQEHDGVDRYVTQVNIVDGQQVERVRHVAKRRKLSGWYLFFDGLGNWTRYAVVGIIVLLFTGLAWLFYGLLGSQVTAGATDAAQLSERAKETRIGNASQLTGEDETLALDTVRKFFQAPTWQERLAFCRRPEETKKLMEKWYATHPDSALTVHGYNFKVNEASLRKGFIKDSGIFVFLDVEVGPQHIHKYVAVEQVPSNSPNKPATYLVDWEVSTNYQPIEIYDYKTKMPPQSMDFRVLCKPSGPNGYYNHSFNDKTKWQAFDLTHSGDPDFSLVGYVPLGSQLERELMEQLYKECCIVLRVHYPQDAVESRQVVIEKIMHPSWFYPRKDALPGIR